MKYTYNYSLYILLALVTFSGAIRKWIIPSGAVGNILLGIVLILPLLNLILVSKDDEGDVEKYNLFTFYLISLLIFGLNPLNQSIYHAIFGFFIHLIFFSILLSYLKNKNNFNAKYFSFFILVCIIIEVILGSIQSVSSADSFINRYAVSEDIETSAALVGDAIRVTGTFSYIAGYSAFQFIGLFASFYLIKKYIFKQYSYLFLALVVYGALISGSRGTVGFVILTSIVFFIFELKILSNTKTLFNIISISIIFMFVNFATGDPLNIVSKFSKSYDNFILRASGSQEEGQKRIFADIDDVLFREFEYKVTGVGLGSTYQGANALFGTTPLLQGITYEGEQFRLILEGGYLLFIFRLILLGYFISKLEFSKIFKIYLFIIIILVMPIVFNIYTSIYLALGLILLNQAYLPELSNKEIEEDSA
ncbi:hypothetical protein A5893_14350 [Pedobacter psychrophilus]|uniref:O-antigen polymerase n=1 Tax=Pedobacter psychrophilus TaxID=1826909 RepID=A0A179DC21_9SPHI|nr:hypothetical protein [Pedobacter psychrophilus]OAQ38591.1 hypothetical protein A5893_14350 [Pedobacter psychrophilus]